MAILKEKDLIKAQRKQVENILKKQDAGKPLTAREERILIAAANDVPIGGENFVRTYDELAQRLSISRRGLQKVCQRFPDEFPTPRADGRHDVAAWLDFFLTRNVKGAAEDAADDDSPVSVTDWRMREIQLKCTRLEIENAKTAGELIDAAEVETGVSVLVGAFNQALHNFAPRLAQKIIGISDYHEAEAIIIEEINVVRRTLQRCDFLAQLDPGKETRETASPVISAPHQTEDVLPELAPSKGRPKGSTRTAAPAAPKAKDKRTPRQRAKSSRA